MTVPGEIARAYWVRAAQEGQPNDLGLKKLTRFGLRDLDFVVEEIAALIVIPNAYVDDAEINLWNYARSELTAAFARKLDQSFLWGIDRPATMGDSVWEVADAAGQVVPSTDLTDGMLQLLASIPGINGIASEGTFPFAVASQNRDALWFDPRGPAGINLFGIRSVAALEGAWDDSKASALVGNWNNAMLGIRQDLTFDMFSEGVITDESGAIVVNLMQQDARAMRAVMRVAWAIRPGRKLDLDGNITDRAPFGALEPFTFGASGASGSSAQKVAAKAAPVKQAPR
jgi:HK97 family phage major capsid protein